MAVFLTILKIIGIVLLCIICLILLVLSLILFVPVRYRIRADKEDAGDDLRAFGQVTYLLHILTGRFIYDKETDCYIKLFGIRIWPKKEKKEKKKSRSVDDEAVTVRDEPVTVGDDEEKPAAESPDLQAIPSGQDYTVDWNEDDDSELPRSEDPPDEAEDKDLFDIIESILEKIQSRYDSFSDKYDSFTARLRYWDKMANDPGNRNAVAYIKDIGIRLLKKIMPRTIKGYVHFGSDDPATLGKILVYISLIYPMLPRKLKIDPDFENADLYGNVDIKGNIRLITIGVAALKVILNRDCRRMWRLYKKHSGKESG